MRIKITDYFLSSPLLNWNLTRDKILSVKPRFFIIVASFRENWPFVFWQDALPAMWYIATRNGGLSAYRRHVLL